MLSLRRIPVGRNVTLGSLEDHQRLVALSQILPMRIGTREMAFNHSVWSIVLEHGWQMSGIEPSRACGHERGNRPSPHQRIHLRHIVGPTTMRPGKPHSSPLLSTSLNTY